MITSSRGIYFTLLMAATSAAVAYSLFEIAVQAQTMLEAVI